MNIQAEKIKQALCDINAFNAGKKREDALESLAVWLPKAQKFTAQVKGAQDYISKREDKNSALARKLHGKEDQYSNLCMEAACMKHSMQSQKRLIDKIPNEVLEQIKQANSKGKVR